MLDITIRTIPHSAQRYPSVGDYKQEIDGNWEFTISEMENPDHCFLVALHELTEWYLTQKAGIGEKDITAFDMKFEAERAKGRHKASAEPGDDPRAIYREAHQTATAFERLMAIALGVDWSVYEKAVNDL